MAEDEIVGYLYRLNGFEQTPGGSEGHSEGDSERQRSLACCSPWGHKESEVTCYNCYIFSLVTEQHKASVKEDDVTIVIIYVNPT